MEFEEEIIKNLKVFLKELVEDESWSTGDAIDNLYFYYERLNLENWNPDE